MITTRRLIVPPASYRPNCKIIDTCLASVKGLDVRGTLPDPYNDGLIDRAKKLAEDLGARNFTRQRDRWEESVVGQRVNRLEFERDESDFQYYRRIRGSRRSGFSGLKVFVRPPTHQSDAGYSPEKVRNFVAGAVGVVMALRDAGHDVELQAFTLSGVDGRHAHLVRWPIASSSMDPDTLSLLRTTAENWTVSGSFKVREATMRELKINSVPVHGSMDMYGLQDPSNTRATLELAGAVSPGERVLFLGSGNGIGFATLEGAFEACKRSVEACEGAEE